MMPKAIGATRRVVNPTNATYLALNADIHTRMCHFPGCANYVASDNPTRYHCSEDCAARCLAARRPVAVRLTHDDPKPDEESVDESPESETE